METTTPKLCKNCKYHYRGWDVCDWEHMCSHPNASRRHVNVVTGKVTVTRYRCDVNRVHECRNGALFEPAPHRRPWYVRLYRWIGVKISKEMWAEQVIREAKDIAE